MIETFELWMKTCKNLTCYSCIFNVQLHIHLKKWTLKFKLLYLRNYASYFNKIRRISCVNTHIKSWKFGSNPYYHNWNTAFFLGDCFLLVHPVDTWRLDVSTCAMQYLQNRDFPATIRCSTHDIVAMYGLSRHCTAPNAWLVGDRHELPCNCRPLRRRFLVSQVDLFCVECMVCWPQSCCFWPAGTMFEVDIRVYVGNNRSRSMWLICVGRARL